MANTSMPSSPFPVALQRAEETQVDETQVDETPADMSVLTREGGTLASDPKLVVLTCLLVIACLFVANIAADIILIKALGLGTAVAVLLDATVVRALLVPATMQLLGDWNWWAPRAVRRLLPARLGGAV